jgi:hypothetical protein
MFSVPTDVPPLHEVPASFLSDTRVPKDDYAPLLEAYIVNPTTSNLHKVSDYVKTNGFTYVQPVVPEDPPEIRKPNTGIHFISDYRFHINPVFHRFLSLPPTGMNPLFFITNILQTMFMTFLSIVTEYCRPAGSADAIFDNFNQPVTPVDDPSPERLAAIMLLIHHFMQIMPYSPITFPDLRFYKWPLVTSADYHCKFSLTLRAESARYWQYLKDTFRLENRFDYSPRVNSKGYFYNSVLLSCRSIIHNIKYTGLPFPTNENDDRISVAAKLRYWFMKYPTQLFVRSQISKTTKLKVRPVYNAPFLFILLEAMLTLPLMAMCRLPQNCLLWGYETIRGGMQELNRIAHSYTTFIMIDWSRFDQLAPFAIIYHFYATFLPQLIRVDQGYMPYGEYSDKYRQYFERKADSFPKDSKKYREYAQSTSSKYGKHIIMFSFLIFNLLSFLWLWYVSMVFVTPDGYGYIRLLAGVPSGIFMTQILDSFVNLFLFVDGLLEFGFSSDEIKLIRLFIQGDDNIAFFIGDFERIFAFYEWFPAYAYERWHMIISIDKSSITRLRNNIEVLGYINRNGMPSRDVQKLVATLAYPERYILATVVENEDGTQTTTYGPEYYQVQMSRAIGIAYANAGHDESVHDLCRKAYLKARKLSKLTEEELRNTEIDYRKLGFYEIFSVSIAELKDILVQDLSSFPDFYAIRTNLRFWHGPHTVKPMWPNHFDDDLSSLRKPEELVTLYDVMVSSGHVIPKHF